MIDQCDVKIPGYLVRLGAEARGEGLLSCDLVGCFACEVDRIISGDSRDLIPIYRDTRDEFVPYNICLDCIRAGRHLEDQS